MRRQFSPAGAEKAVNFAWRRQNPPAAWNQNRFGPAPREQILSIERLPVDKRRMQPKLSL